MKTPWGGGLKGKELFCLQCDVSKYFASIDHKILLSIIKKKIFDGKTLRLIEKIIDSSFEKKIYENLFDYRIAGIPIGNLTSQLFANVYLNELDQFVKHSLRQKYYLRYMDDFLILEADKRDLHLLKEKLGKFLKDNLRLTLHPKKANIFPAEKGIDFLGYRIFRHYRLLRKSGVKRFIRRTKAYRIELIKGKMTQEKFDQCLQSWVAYAQFANSWRLRNKIGFITL
ncbi:hypothetical protein COS21_04100 [bacterium (Candidatus Gribaldobacteria) CG02_land_8_20_14_3_00_41_15]|uniref:Reverse transcriptase domain-containing protein n=1 Tax=bacterium (Candidatus Gribaldobacteria) CG02_land_8_20_14_3_00_41_15 TaxID=2014270 RepID=A0A2M7DCU4_9BACT|nr:MAG: hypothetical protein COS21_04100 [bacterium (Candidatus Gribaldobacteria) CG02_land_8_20_14_3_00_41_15]